MHDEARVLNLDQAQSAVACSAQSGAQECLGAAVRGAGVRGT